TPSHHIRPLVGSVSLFSMRSKVDLPAPERPITPTNWPAGMLSDTSPTAHTRPKVLLILSVTSRKSSAGRPCLGAAAERVISAGCLCQRYCGVGCGHKRDI